MTSVPDILSAAVRESASRSVLCWLATVDADGHPNVSPKEVWSIVDAQHVVVANIASPISAHNIANQSWVCLSFIDVFVQKGYKLQGHAREVLPDASDFDAWAAPLQAMVGKRFLLRSVFVITVDSVTPIVAPSYRFYPESVTETSQRQAAMQAYGVKPIGD